MANQSDDRPVEHPDARLERALRQEFLQDYGIDDEGLRQLPLRERERLEKEAAKYVSGRLAEVKARAHLIEELHHED